MKTVSPFRAIFSLSLAALVAATFSPAVAAEITPAATSAVATATISDTKPAPKALLPRQIVVVVADGISPQLVNFGANYIQKAFDQTDDIAFQNLQKQAVVQNAASISSLKNLLTNAQANGYKTGLVTTADVSQVAPLFFDLGADKDAASALSSTRFDFVAGGGRARFGAAATKNITTAGGTVYLDSESLSEEGKGKILALQSDGDLSYSLDRDQEKEAGFEELISQAFENLSQNDAPYVLVIHDSLIGKALAARDTPAVAESFHQLDGIVDDLLTRQTDGNGNFAFSVLSNGATTAPVLTSDKAAEVSNTFFILSNLPLSYAGAGAKLKGADADAITDFSTYEYKGWKVSSADSAAITAGTLDAEKAIRASYEPSLQIAYKDVAPVAAAWSVGFPTSDDTLQEIQKIAAQKPAIAVVSASATDESSTQSVAAVK